MLTCASLANGFAYWQYQDINNATKTYFDDMAQALNHVQTVTGGLDKVHFMNGGTSNPLPSFPLPPTTH
jgi:glucan 1,3-beta-glucosidase